MWCYTNEAVLKKKSDKNTYIKINTDNQILVFLDFFLLKPTVWNSLHFIQKNKYIHVCA